MKLRWLLVVSAFCGFKGFAGMADPAADPFAARRALFDYDPRAGFAVVERSVEQRGDIAIRDVLLQPRVKEAGPEIEAYLVAPVAAQSVAGILWVHWLGEPATSNRTQFLEEAVALARRGVGSVLVDAMWSRPRWYPTRNLDEDRAHSIRQVIELRQALDVLLAQPGVDPARVALVAHDYGAMHGIIVAGVDRRVRACVWIAATRSFTDWAFFAKKPAAMDQYLAQNRELELVDFLRETHGVPLLMQFARQDDYVPVERAEALFAAAHEPKVMRLYPAAKHEMTAPAEIRADRDAWLARTLGLKSEP